jgi:hypothetical protein
MNRYTIGAAIPMPRAQSNTPGVDTTISLPEWRLTMDEFFTSWYFIGLMAFLLVAISIGGPIAVILVIVYANRKQRRRDERERYDTD